MIVEGLIGTIYLFVSTAEGEGLHALSGASCGMIAIAAIFAYSGIVMGTFTISIGIAGIVVAIYNAGALIHILLSVIFLH